MNVPSAPPSTRAGSAEIRVPVDRPAGTVVPVFDRVGLSRVGLSWVAAHGGAGASTLTAALGGADIGCRWPDESRAEPARVMLVARTHNGGLRAAARALDALREGRHTPGMELVGLVLVADAPGRLPPSLRRRIRVLRSVAPLLRVPWIEPWRVGEQATRVPKALLRLGAFVGEFIGDET